MLLYYYFHYTNSIIYSLSSDQHYHRNNIASTTMTSPNSDQKPDQTATTESASNIDAFWKAMRDQLNPRSAPAVCLGLFSAMGGTARPTLKWEVKNQRACDVVEIREMVAVEV